VKLVHIACPLIRTGGNRSPGTQSSSCVEAFALKTSISTNYNIVFGADIIFIPLPVIGLSQNTSYHICLKVFSGN